MKATILVLALAASLLLAGCGDSANTTPPPQAMAPRDSTPPKIPSTVDEKIKAIQDSGIPEAQKKEAIEKVKSGAL